MDSWECAQQVHETIGDVKKLDDENLPDRIRPKLKNEDHPEKLDRFWDLSGLDKRYADNGFSNKLSSWMFVQLALAIFYVVAFSITMAQSESYYIWPPLDEEDLLTGDAPIVRTEELLFECNGHIYYQECYGPKYSSGNYYDPNRKDYCDDPESTYAGLVTTYSIFFGLMILTFVAFCYHRIYYGFYNELSGLVKFKKNDTGGGGFVYKPVKFAVAYSLFCNYAKGGIAVFQSDLCGRLGFFGDSVSVAATFFASIYLLCYLIFILGIWYIPCYLCCDCCGNSCCSCVDKHRAYRSGRIMLLVASVSLLLSRCITSFTNFSINFGKSLQMSFVLSQILTSQDVSASIFLLFQTSAFPTGQFYLSFLCLI
jgi:hypothetical protein